MNFWYDLALRTTIASTLTKHGRFTREDLRRTRDAYRGFRRGNYLMVKDLLSEYHLSWSSMVAAIYLTLREKGCGLDEAVEATGDLVFKNMGSDSVAGYISVALDRAKDRFAYIVRSSKRQEVGFFGTTFEFYRPTDTEGAYRLRVRSCFYNDFFRKNGLPELMRVACRWDIISWSKGIVPERHGIRFSRPKTLGLDNVDCEFDFERLDDGVSRRST